MFQLEITHKGSLKKTKKQINQSNALFIFGKASFAIIMSFWISLLSFLKLQLLKYFLMRSLAQTVLNTSSRYRLDIDESKLRYLSKILLSRLSVFHCADFDISDTLKSLGNSS